MSNLYSQHVGWRVLIVSFVLAAAGCTQSVGPIEDMASFDPSEDQMAMAGYYRPEAGALKEKAATLAESQRPSMPRPVWPLFIFRRH